jgi:signal recognition particle subunit SRP19
MRKLDHQVIIWPVYFDCNKTRMDGRRVPKNCAVQAPKILELKEAADKLGLQNEVNLEAHHPRTPWAKTGMMIVEKNEPKEKINQKIAKQLVKIKSQQAQLPTKR